MDEKGELGKGETQTNNIRQGEMHFTSVMEGKEHDDRQLSYKMHLKSSPDHIQFRL